MKEKLTRIAVLKGEEAKALNRARSHGFSMEYDGTKGKERLEFYKCETVERKIIEEEKKDGVQLKHMACVGICETFPSVGKTGYHAGIKFCSKCNRFMYSDNVFCLCCSGNLRVGPYNKRERAKRKA